MTHIRRHGPAMKLGIAFFAAELAIRPDELARAVEERGFESLFFTDHTHIPATPQTRTLMQELHGGVLPRFTHNHDPFVALTYAAPSIEDYAEHGAAQRERYEAQNGRQAGDPAKLAQALVTIAGQQPPPRRFIAGADAIAVAEQKVKDLQEQINAYRDLSTSMALEEM